MSTAAGLIVWALVSAPVPFAKSVAVTDVYTTLGECVHEATEQTVIDMKHHENLHWHCERYAVHYVPSREQETHVTAARR